MADKEAASAPVGAAADIEDGATRLVFDNDLLRTEAALKAQPKVTVKCHEDTHVQINGYSFYIKAKTKVQVPQQVAEILEEAGRI